MLQQMFASIGVSILAWCALPQFACSQPSPYRAHDLDRPKPPIVTPGDGNVARSAPSDAIALFDGTDLAAWCQPGGGDPKWRLENGAMLPVPNGGALETRQAFGDVQVHVEWASPVPPKGDGQGRGNSGVYFMTKYEVQVLDSFDNPTYADGQAASVYGQNPPLVNASLPPGEWQAYDIIFHRPRFDDSGALQSPATVTVLHNGVLVQDQFAFWGPTNWLKFDAYRPHAEKLPIRLQDHGNPVRYRNIWLRELPEEPRYSGLAELTSNVELTEEQMQRLVGKYGQTTVDLHNGQLRFGFFGRWFELVPTSELEFQFKRTAARLIFEEQNGEITAVTRDLMGGKQRLERET